MSNSDASFLTVFFYLPQNQRENVENLIQFLQKHHMNFGRIQNETYWGPLHQVVKNANFVAQSYQPLSKVEFEFLSQFFVSKVILVAFFYKNQIWNVSRLQKITTSALFLQPSAESSPVVLSQLSVFWKGLQKIQF
jgi:hypothetical protein